jgi:dihydrofolate reductase
MKVTCVMLSPVDGKIVKWEDGDTYAWNSKEDQQHFDSFVKKATLIVMGRRTFEVAKPSPKKGVLRIVMTGNPVRYDGLAVPGLLEFSRENPTTLVAKLEKRGYKNLLLVGGGGTNTAFFQAQLVDELWLTIEPKIFGKGKMIVNQTPMDIQLKLEMVKKLNKQGTILLKYRVDKDHSIR